MNDFLRNFVMNTIKKMIADNVDEWQIRQYALGWYEKMVLVKEDLETIETLYAEKEVMKEEEIAEEVIEDDRG